MLVSFKMDPPMDKAKLISNCASMLVISYLRRGKNTQLQMKRVVKICERNNSIETKVKEEGGEGDAPGARAEIILQFKENTMVMNIVPLQPMEDHLEQISTLHPVEDSKPEQEDVT